MSQAEKRERRRNTKRHKALMAQIEAGIKHTAERSEAQYAVPNS